MATPRSQPYIPSDQIQQNVLDVPMSNPIGSAISKIGKDFLSLRAKLKEEKQASVDRTASLEFRNQTKLAEMQYNAAVSQANTEEEIDKALEARSGAVSDFLGNREVSQPVRERLTADIDLFRKESFILADASKAQLQSKREKAITEETAVNLASSGELSEALAFLDESPAFSDAEKIKMGGQLRREFDRVAKEEYNLAIRQSRSPEEIDSIVESLDSMEGSELMKSQVRKSAEFRKDTVRREDHSLLSSEISLEKGIVSRVESGDAPTKEELDSMNIDDDLKATVLKASEQIKSGFGLKSAEYSDFKDRIDDMLDKSGVLSQSGKGELESDDYKAIMEEIQDSKWSSEAQFSLISTMAKIRAIDARKDKDLFGFFKSSSFDPSKYEFQGQEIDLDEGQVQALEAASEEMSKLLNRDRRGNISPSSIDMSATDYVDLFMKLQDPKRLDAFKDKEKGTKEWEDAFKMQFLDNITASKKQTAIKALRERILGKQLRQAQLRRDISGGN